MALSEVCWRVISFRCNMTLYNRGLIGPGHEGETAMRHPRFAAIIISLIGLLMLASVAHAARIPSPLQPATTPEPNPSVSSGNTGGTTNTNTGNAATYVVKQGETLFKIAVRFNLTVQELATANGI